MALQPGTQTTSKASPLSPHPKAQEQAEKSHRFQEKKPLPSCLPPSNALLISALRTLAVGSTNKEQLT